MTEEDNFLTKQKFSKMVEQTANILNLTYMDSIIHLSEKHNIELEDIKRYLSSVVRERVEAEAQNLNYLPRPSRLPLE
jgi:cell division ATPase FtsA